MAKQIPASSSPAAPPCDNTRDGYLRYVQMLTPLGHGPNGDPYDTALQIFCGTENDDVVLITTLEVDEAVQLYEGIGRFLARVEQERAASAQWADAA